MSLRSLQKGVYYYGRSKLMNWEWVARLVGEGES